MGEEDYDLEGGGDGEMAFNDKSVRRGFIRKVYGILLCQLIITGALIAAFMFVAELKM